MSIFELNQCRPGSSSTIAFQVEGAQRREVDLSNFCSKSLGERYRLWAFVYVFLRLVAFF